MRSDLGTEREDRHSDADAEYYATLGERICEDCGHAIAKHGVDGCMADRTRQIEASSETESGPCGCDCDLCQIYGFHDDSVDWADLSEI